MNEITWPLIILVGGSQQSNQWYSDYLKTPLDEIHLVADVVNRHFNGHLINLAKSGSSNKRHIRRSILECLIQRKLNPKQRIILLLEITFDLRQEIWIDENSIIKDDFESNFYQIQIAHNDSWWKDRGNNLSDVPNEIVNHVENHAKYFKKWLESHRYFYSPYAELIYLYQDILGLTYILKKEQIEYVIFRGNPIEKFETTIITQILKENLDNDPNVLNLETFSFTQWCLEHPFLPVENNLLKNKLSVGHPSLEAHRAFANQIILPILDRK